MSDNAVDLPAAAAAGNSTFNHFITPILHFYLINYHHFYY
jgi:hypothetical protein